MATANAYAIPTNLDIGSSSTTFTVEYSAVVGDGVSQSRTFSGGFTYDATQTPATNLATFKAAVASAALNYGFTVAVSNILVFTAVN